MPDNAHVLSSHNIFSREAILQETTPTQHDVRQDRQNPRDVRQDKYAPSRGESVSAEPVPLKPQARTEVAPSVPKHHGSQKRRTQQIAGWVMPHIKAEVLRLAASKGWTQSRAVATLVESALQRSLGEQYATMLRATIEDATVKANRAMATRFAVLLVRIAFDTGQTRVLATNTLGRQEGMTEETLKEILQTADRRTKANLTRKTPQLTELINLVEQWLVSGEEETK